MKETFLAVRAIGSEFASQLWNSSFILASICGVTLIALLVWLTSLSNWWWLLAIPIGIALSVAIALLVVFRLLIKQVRPTQTAEQKQQTKAFVTKLQFAADITSTPKFIVLFRTIRSIAAPKSDRYLQEIFETKNLKKDFQGIAKTFKE